MWVGAASLGGLVGIVFGGAYLMYDGPKSASDLPAYVAAGALEGAILGAVIGGAAGAEKWTTIYAKPKAGGALRNRPSIGLSITGLGQGHRPGLRISLGEFLEFHSH